jgi:hypothetical protein
MSDDVYQNLPLDAVARQIRLLTLEPAFPTDPLCCNLEISSLDDKPSFYAISYVWGDVNDMLSITVNGAELSIIRNLAVALRRLRTEKPAGRIRLWADALCINQSSIDEKTHQVGLMRDIYSSCREVFVTLGDFNPNLGDLVPHRYQYEKLLGFPGLVGTAACDNPMLEQYLDDLKFERDPADSTIFYTCALFTFLLLGQISLSYPHCLGVII